MSAASPTRSGCQTPRTAVSSICIGIGSGIGAGVESPTERRDMLPDNLVEKLTESLRRNWERDAYTDWEGGTYTYGDLAARIFQIHYIFDEIDLQPGDKVALVGRNSAHWAITYLATITYGAVIVPILPDFTSDEIQHIVNHSDSRVLFASAPIFDAIDERRMPRLEAILALNDFDL